MISFPACCSPDGDNSPTHLCFLQLNFKDESKDPAMSGPNKSSNHDPGTGNNSSHCLPAQPVITGNGSKPDYCFSPHYTCLGDEKETHCVLPRIVRDYKRFRTVQIHRRQYYRKESVLFVGDVFDLVNGVRTSEFVPRDFFLSRLMGYSRIVLISVQLETVLLLTAGLSAGLAVVNMLPIYGLDGYHVVDALVRCYMGKRWDGRKVTRVVNVISWAALAVALLTVMCSVVQNM